MATIYENILQYGRTKLVVNAHIDEVVNLVTVKGSSYERILGFYESLRKYYDALRTLGEHTRESSVTRISTH